MGKFRPPKFVMMLAFGYLFVIFVLASVTGGGRGAGKLWDKDKKVSKDSRKSSANTAVRTGAGRTVKQGKIETLTSELEEPEDSSVTVDGTFLTKYEQGSLSAEWPFERGRLNASLKFYYPGGALWRSIPFLVGQEEGVAKVYDSTDQVIRMTAYAGGIQNGWMRWYYSNGQVWFEQLYAGGKPSSALRLFSENGELRTTTAVTSPGASQDQGVFKAFTPDGEIKTQWTFSGGLMEGAVTSFYDNGKQSSEWLMKDSRPHGETRLFYPDGSLWKELRFREGVRDGRQTEYYPSGEKMAETSFMGGRREGRSVIYYRNGKVLAQFEHHEGRHVGSPKGYSEAGANWFADKGGEKAVEISGFETRIEVVESPAEVSSAPVT